MKIIDIFRNEKGAAAVMISVMLTTLIGMAALAIDSGAYYLKKRTLQNALDLSVTAACEHFPSDSVSEAEEEAKNYLQANGFDVDGLDLSFEYEKDSSGSVYYSIKLNAKAPIDYSLAGVLGIYSSVVSCTSKAASLPISQTDKALPLYVTEEGLETFSKTASDGCPFNIRLNENGQVTGTMNFGVVGIGVSDSETQVLEYLNKGYYGLNSNGQKKGMAVGDVMLIDNALRIYSDAFGAINSRIAHCKCRGTYETYDEDCTRIAFLPVVSEKDGCVTVNSFVAIFINSVKKGNSAGTKYTEISAVYLGSFAARGEVVNTTQNIKLTRYTVCGTVLIE